MHDINKIHKSKSCFLLIFYNTTVSTDTTQNVFTFVNKMHDQLIDNT